MDIIDFAKVIGNRAAGRQYGVAESSIREWRKNDAKLKLVFFIVYLNYIINKQLISFISNY